MIKFIPSDATGLPLKRKQSQLACESCRRRKRKCVHGSHGASSGPEVLHHKTPNQLSAHNSQAASRIRHPQNENSSQLRISGPSNGLKEQTGASDVSTPEQLRIESSRFVGDLNPQGVFMEATSTAVRDLSHHGRVGVWHSKGPSLESTNLARTGFPETSQLTGFFQTNLAARESLMSYFQDEFLCCVPPAPHFDALRDIYKRKVRPVFPILDQWTFSTDDVSPSTVITKQALCLAASMNRDAAPHLRLGLDGLLLTHQDFSRRLSMAMRSAVDFGLITDKPVLIRSLAVLSLFMEPRDSSEEDLPALLNSRAVHHMQTIGLHHEGQRTGPDAEAAESLFCALWALDRMTAAFYGRPIILHEQDFGRDLDSCIQRQEPCFRLFLMVMQWLDKVISLYRPNSTSSATEMAIEMPGFEDLILAAGATRAVDTTLATIEIFYHAICILSCRASPPHPHSQPHTPQPHSSISNIRGSYSAGRITAIIADEFHRQLPLLPVVPYALSLSLGVAYRELRHSKVPLCRARAKVALSSNCTLLGELGDRFKSAGVMARMGKQVLEEMGRAIDSIANVRPREGQRGDNRADGNRTETLDSDQSTVETSIVDTGNSYDDVFGQLPDLDVFEYFDPNFDLNAVDMALGANLDVGMSLNGRDWGQFPGY